MRIQGFILCFFTLLGDNLWGQSIQNISGDWVGTRQQFNDVKNGYKEDFKYKYSLSQYEDKVVGVVYITKSNGDYAELAVKGYVSDDIFYFQEYEVLNAKRSNGFKWCLKAGILYIDSIGPHEYRLKGQTQSTMEYYNSECTGGYTMLTRKEIHIGEGVMVNAADVDATDLNNAINVYPNPFKDKTNVSITLPKSYPVYIDVIDVNGNTIQVLLSGNVLQAGSYSYSFELSTPSTTPQFYYLRVRIGLKTYTRILQRN